MCYLILILNIYSCICVIMRFSLCYWGEHISWGLNCMQFLMFFCVFGVSLERGDLGFFFFFWGGDYPPPPPPQEIAGNNTARFLFVMQRRYYSVIVHFRVSWTQGIERIISSSESPTCNGVCAITRGAYPLCGQYCAVASITEVMVVLCPRNTAGNSVIIQLPVNGGDVLNFCELEVYTEVWTFEEVKVNKLSRGHLKLSTNRSEAEE